MTAVLYCFARTPTMEPCYRTHRIISSADDNVERELFVLPLLLLFRIVLRRSHGENRVGIHARSTVVTPSHWGGLVWVDGIA